MTIIAPREVFSRLPSWYT